MVPNGSFLVIMLVAYSEPVQMVGDSIYVKSMI